MVHQKTQRIRARRRAPSRYPKKARVDHQAVDENFGWSLGALAALPRRVCEGRARATQPTTRLLLLHDAAIPDVFLIDASRCAARRRGQSSPFLRSAHWRSRLVTCAGACSRQLVLHEGENEHGQSSTDVVDAGESSHESFVDTASLSRAAISLAVGHSDPRQHCLCPARCSMGTRTTCTRRRERERQS